MTLCIAYRHFKREEYDQNFVISDSRLTVIRQSPSPPVEQGLVLLPSNQEIVHQNDSGIKIHVIHYEKKSGRRDITITVAGAVAMGMLTAMHLEATLNGLYGKYNYQQVLHIIEEHIDRFWQGAYDQDIEYLIMLADDDGWTHLFKKTGVHGRIGPMVEISEQHGLLFGVIGDRATEVEQRILGEVNQLTAFNRGMPFEEALDIACVRALRAAIEDESNLLVGGGIQAAVMKGIEGYYMTASYRDRYYFRGVEFGPELRSDNAPLKHPMWFYSVEKYDPTLPLAEIAEMTVKPKGT